MLALWLMFSVVVVLLAYLGWRDHSERKDRRDLLNRILARTPGELRALDARPVDYEAPSIDPEIMDFLRNGEPIGM